MLEAFMLEPFKREVCIREGWRLVTERHAVWHIRESACLGHTPRAHGNACWSRYGGSWAWRLG